MSRFKRFFEVGRANLMRHYKKILLGLAIFFAVFTIVGFLALPPIVKSVLTKQLSQNLHREVTIQKIKMNPYALSLTIQGLMIKDRGSSEPFVSFEEFYVNLQSLSIFKRALLLKEIRLKQPYIRVLRQSETSYNFSDLLESKEAKPAEPKPKEKSKPFLFSLNNIRIENGSVDFWDGPKQTQHKVRELNIGVPFVSNVPYYVHSFVQPAFSARINDTRHSYQGKTKPFADSLETDFDIEFTDLNIPYYLAYAPFKMDFKIPSGALDAKVRIAFVQSKDKHPDATVSGEIALKKFEVDDERGTPLLKLPRVTVSIAPSKPIARIIHLSKISVQEPELHVGRTKTGAITVESMVPKMEAAKPLPPGGKEETPIPLALDIDEIQLTGGKVSFSDLSPSIPFKTIVSPIDLKVDHFSNGKEKKSNYALLLKTEANETVKVEGDLTMEPLRAEGTVEINSVPLKKYRPYYHDKILFDIEEGRLDFSTRYKYAKGEKEPEVLISGLSTSVRSLRLKKRDEKEDFLKIPLISVKNTQIDLSQKKFTLGEFSTEKGMISLNRLKNGEIDLMKLLPPPPPKEESPVPAKTKPAQAKAAKEEKPWVFTLVRLAVDQYAVRVDDATPSQPTTVNLEKVKINAENISTAKNAAGKVSLSLLLDKQATISARTTVTLEPLKAEGSAELKQISLRQYAPYYRDTILFDFEEGELDLATNYRYIKKEKDQETKLSGLSASLRTLRLKKRGEQEEFLNIPALAVRNTSLDLTKREVTIGEFLTQRGSILVKRFKDGKLNLQTLFPAPPKQEGNGQKAVQAVGAEKAAQEAVTEAEKPWLIKVEKVSADEYGVKVEDQTPAEPVTLGLHEIRLTAANLSTAEGQTGSATLDFRLNDKGSVSLSGSVGISPLSANLKMALKDIELKPVQPYFTDKVKITVTDGTFSTAGDLSVKDQKETGLQITYKGKSGLSNFSSIDKLKAEDFLKWASLTFEEMDVSYNPMRVNIQGISLSDFYARVIMEPDGTLNLSEIMVKEEPKKETPPPAKGGEKAAATPQEKEPPKGKGPSRDIKIGTITLQAGTIEVSDRSVKPGYSAKLVEIGGRVSGLSSEETTRADLDLRGKLDGSAPLEITGKINPLKEDLFVDLKVRFKDMDLSPVTPYAGKYAGYTIQKGKLSLDLSYQIDKRKLDSKNVIFLDQFTFGDKIESPQATKLPVKLAIALLKDRKGEIRLDIPVKGSLDDPKFSIGKIILQILLNLIAKAATSPFALLGAVFGGGEELSYLEFDSGSAAIADANAKKLNTLIKALSDRPGLKLDIEGHVDAEKDRDGLIKYFFDRKLKAQKLNEMVKKGVPPVPVDDVKIETAEYAKYLKAAYKQEKFPKPTYILGIEKDLPVPEMEKLMLTHTVVGEGELRALASQRSLKVKEAILKSGQVESERIFILEPKTLAPEKKEKLKDSRVELKLK